MNYTEARAYLKEIESRGSVLGLQSMRALLEQLGNPQDQLKFIHIAGTNGKGSVLAYLSTILKEAGYRVGRYISPTIFSYRERIQVNEAPIGREELARLTGQVKQAAERIEAEDGFSPTVFEAETALAFLYFLQMKCDIVVLETGMGGDTDATNVVKTSVLEVFMPISLDHMQFLGDTLEKIAEHKAGIIKPGTMAVSAPQQAEALRVLKRRAKEQGAAFYVLDPSEVTDVVYGLHTQCFTFRGREHLKISLAGVCQILNAATAVLAVDALKTLGWEITDAQLRAGFMRTVWRGRFDVLKKEPLFIVDGAHNRDGARALASSVETYLKGRRIIAICGVFKDKEYEEILKTAAPYLNALIAICTPDNPRALPKEELVRTAQKYIARVQAAESIEEAVDEGLRMAGPKDAVLAFGSLSFIGEITKAVQKRTVEA